MTTHARSPLAAEFDTAMEQLGTALRSASAAVATLRALSPRVARMDALLAQIETALSGEPVPAISEAPAPAPAIEPESPPAAETFAPSPAPFIRPSLVIPGVPPAAMSYAPTSMLPEHDAPGHAPVIPAMQPASASSAPLKSFRIAFESQAGPLDLRAVDDALGSHPGVRDVALLDYDGRRATLKVWILASAQPSDIESALKQNAELLFDADAQVSIVALDDVA